MPGSGFGSEREGMLIKYMANWVRENAKPRPAEIGGLEVISAIYRFAEAANRCAADSTVGCLMGILIGSWALRPKDSANMSLETTNLREFFIL